MQLYWKRTSFRFIPLIFAKIFKTVFLCLSVTKILKDLLSGVDYMSPPSFPYLLKN